jgi:prepilin-type N-terminal cleavage/methylation domain-containing protein
MAGHPGNRGFTLIEIIVAVALVAILSAAVAPGVLNNIAQGRFARAQSDVQILASAIMRFKSDTGVFPRCAKAANPDTAGNKFDFLASRGGDFPKMGSGSDWSSAAFTNGTVAPGSVEDFTNHLINGSSRTTTSDSLYTRAPQVEDPGSFGFRGGIVSSDPPDPWGHKYICNVAALGEPGQAVWVISAGPDGVISTPVADTGFGASDVLGSDDIGFRIQ